MARTLRVERLTRTDQRSPPLIDIRAAGERMENENPAVVAAGAVISKHAIPEVKTLRAGPAATGGALRAGPAADGWSALGRPRGRRWSALGRPRGRRVTGAEAR